VHPIQEHAPIDHAEDRETLWDLIKDIKFAMFTTRHANGHLHSRPMTTQNRKIDEDASLWFFMPRSSGSLADVGVQPTVNVSYADPDGDHYVSVSGDAFIVEDLARKQRLWNKKAAAWFPKGVNDPDLALVQVRITHADYWESKDNRLTQLFKTAAAAVTGRRAAVTGEHVRVTMR